MIASKCRLDRHELIQSCRVFTQVLCQPSEFCEGLVDIPSQSRPFYFHIVEGLLHMSEEAPHNVQGDDLGSKLP